jgi:hypothetical protein
MLSENEITSVDEIVNRYNLSYTDPLVFMIYIKENPSITESEACEIYAHIAQLRKKMNNINNHNITYIKNSK